MKAGLNRALWSRFLLSGLVAFLGVALWMSLELHRSSLGHHDHGRILGAETAPESLAFGLLAMVTLVAMGPCVMQMGIILVAFWSGIPPSLLRAPAKSARSPALWFLVGYLLTFGLGVALFIAIGQQFPAFQVWMRAAAGVILAVSGALLFTRPAGHSCNGPDGFLLRYGGWHPIGMGAAYAAYCAACCGPYLAGLGLILAGRGLGAGTVAGSLILVPAMALPVLAPLFMKAAVVRQFLSRYDQVLRLSSGLMLVAVGLLMIGTNH